MKEFPAGPFSGHCIACQSTKIKRDWSIISSFFALRAFGMRAQIAGFMKCDECNSRYFDVGLSDAQVSRFYTGYRGADYVEQRNRFEPSYTSAFNSSLGGDAGMTERRAVLKQSLDECGITHSFDAVLDHGGDRGQMLKDLGARRKCVFEISDAEPDTGVERITEAQLKSGDWDLILCCHVLEHLIDPGTYMTDLAALGRSGSHYFIEIPHEPARSFFFNQTIIQKIWLTLLLKNLKLLTKFDIISGGFIARYAIVPPFLFFALREHLTFFSLRGIKKFIEHRGLDILLSKFADTGHIVVIARKK